MIKRNQQFYFFSKSIEIESLIKSKNSEVVKHLNENFKTLLCIDISCELLNIPFNSEEAIRIAGTRKREFNNNRKMLLKILNLDKKMDISDVILKLGILQSTSLEKTARKIFEQYRREQYRSDEVNHPSVVAMCVNYATKIEHVKIPKKNIVTISNLTTSQWNAMEKSWSSWAGSVETKKKNKKNKENVEDVVMQDEKNSEQNIVSEQNKHEEEESYENWEKRILEKAHAALKAMKEQTS